MNFYIFYSFVLFCLAVHVTTCTKILKSKVDGSNNLQKYGSFMESSRTNGLLQPSLDKVSHNKAGGAFRNRRSLSSSFLYYKRNNPKIEEALPELSIPDVYDLEETTFTDKVKKPFCNGFHGCHNSPKRDVVLLAKRPFCNSLYGCQNIVGKRSRPSSGWAVRAKKPFCNGLVGCKNYVKKFEIFREPKEPINYMLNRLNSRHVIILSPTAEDLIDDRARMKQQVPPIPNKVNKPVPVDTVENFNGLVLLLEDSGEDGANLANAEESGFDLSNKDKGNKGNRFLPVMASPRKRPFCNSMGGCKNYY